jgi:pullulanase/glycogen debranching enzyme
MDLTRHRSAKKVAVPDRLTQLLDRTKIPPGASATAEGVNFSVFSKNASRAELLLYDAADSPKPVQVISLDADTNRSYFFWHVFVEGLPAGTHYTWRVDGGKELVDLWARAVTDSLWIRRKAVSDAKSACNSIRAVVTRVSELSPCKSPIVPGLNGAVIYELHVGGFTRHPSSGVHSPGKFLGLIEKIFYLKKLGITHVELLPVMAFDCKHPLYRCSGRTYLGNRLSPSRWSIDSQNRWRDRTELESNPPTSQSQRKRVEFPVERKKLNRLSRKSRSDPAWREKLRYCDAALIGCSDWSVAKTWL